jgi:hypothetical protein
MVRIFAATSTAALVAAQPSCNQVDGDYPGCGLSKLTHASSQPIKGKQFMQKYFNVQAPGDECTDDICDCSSDGSPDIEQGRVFTTRQVSPSAGAMPGNGFGLHLVSVPGHWTKGGLTVEEVEAHFNEKLGDMTKFDSFMDFTAILATSSLQAYKSAFDQDGVKYLLGTWVDSNSKQYTSLIVQVPNSQLLLELVQQTSLTLAAGELAPLIMEQRVPDSALAQQEQRLSGVGVSDTTTDYVVSLGISRAVSTQAMAKLEGFYVSGMGTTKTHDATEGDVSKKCFLWPGASANICFTSRPDSATSGNFTVGDFEDMLNSVHKTIIDGHPFCPMDRWFDNHYAVDSHSWSATQILNYVNTEKPFHTCSTGSFGPSGVSAIWDPTGMGIQMDGQIGYPNDCSTDETRESPFPLKGGKFNPACTADTSKCGGSPSPSPSPAPGPTPVPGTCDQATCYSEVSKHCGLTGTWARCMDCMYANALSFATTCPWLSCRPVISAGCATPPTSV